MLGRIARTAILLLLGVIFILFLVANRHTATISVDPFNSANPAYAAPVPLGVLMLVPLKRLTPNGLTLSASSPGPIRVGR